MCFYEQHEYACGDAYWGRLERLCYASANTPQGYHGCQQKFVSTSGIYRCSNGCFMCQILTQKKSQYEKALNALADWDHSAPPHKLQWTGQEYVKTSEFDRLMVKWESLEKDILDAIERKKMRDHTSRNEQHSDIGSLHRLGERFLDLKNGCEEILPAFLDNVDRDHSQLNQQGLSIVATNRSNLT